MSKHHPLVSVCIPTRNRDRWIQVALHSVFDQTLEDFEAIVFDDASTDATAEVAGRWGDARLHYHRHPAPVGVAANRNACLSKARGEYVAWLDSDDAYHPRMLEAQVARLESLPRAVLVHGATDIIDAGGARLPDWLPAFAGDVVEPGAEAFRELALHNYIAAPTVLVRRRAHDVAGPYSENLASGEDWEMWLRLALVGDVAYTAERVGRYRWHDESLTRRTEAQGKHLARDLGILSRLFTDYQWKIPDGEVVEAQARAAVAARAVLHATDRLLRGDAVGAVRDCLLAMRARPMVAGNRSAWRLVAAALQGDEFRWHVESRRLLRLLADAVDGSRLAGLLRDRTTSRHGWQGTLRSIARTVREVVPSGDAIAAVDKWDPTLLHLSQRRGWHFPDRRTMPEGYPPDSHAAIRHLEDLRLRGVRYLVFPCSAFWWLEHYGGLTHYLEVCAVRAHADDRCIIYRLKPGASCAA
jgi:GT2 family glycosyltransferase